MREEILLRKISAGDKAALEELVRLYYPEICRYCSWHAPDSASAEDAVQETFLKAIKYMNSCCFSGKFRPFLYKIAANVCIDMRRAKWSRIALMEDMKEEPSYEERGFDAIQDTLWMKTVVRRLPAQEQEIVMLRFGQELKLREIADIMDLPMRTVQSKLRAALRKIKEDWKGV